MSDTQLACRQIKFKQAAAGNVHSGFYLSLTDPTTYQYDETPVNGLSAYTEIKQAIQSALTLVGNQSLPIIFTGHSLVSVCCLG